MPKKGKIRGVKNASLRCWVQSARALCSRHNAQAGQNTPREECKLALLGSMDAKACIERSAVREHFRSTIKEFIDEILQHQSSEYNSDLANRFAEAGITPMVLAAVPKEDLLHQFSLPGNIATISQVADIISLQQAALVQKRPPSEFCRSPPPSRVKRKRKCIRKHRLPVGRGRGSVKGIWGLRRRKRSFK